MFDLKTFLFVDEPINEYCPMHNFKKVKFVSKLNNKTFAKGHICMTCEMKMENYQDIIIRSKDKWLKLEDYKTEVLTD